MSLPCIVTNVLPGEMSNNERAHIQSVFQRRKSVYDLDENGYTALFIAAKHGWVDLIRNLLLLDEHQVNHVPNKQTTTAINIAALYSQYEAMEFLIIKKANLNVGKPSLLYLAYTNPNKHYFKLVVESGADLDITDSHFYGSTLLNHMVHNKNFNAKRLRYVLDNGADIAKKGFNGYTAFHIAIKQQSIMTLKLLLNSVEDKKILDGIFYRSNSFPIRKVGNGQRKWCNQQNIFTYAVMYGSIDIIKLLLQVVSNDERFRECNTKDPSSPTCLLHTAMYSRLCLRTADQVVRLLLQNGFQANGCTLQLDEHFLCYFNHFEAIDTVKLGTTKGKSQISLLDCAVLNNQPKIVSELLKFGAEVNPFSNMIAHPLVLAVTMGLTNICKYLLANGANPNYTIERRGQLMPVVLMASCTYINECLFEIIKAGGKFQYLSQTFWRKIEDQNKGVFEKLQLLIKAVNGEVTRIPYNPKLFARYTFLFFTNKSLTFLANRSLFFMRAQQLYVVGIESCT